MKEVSIKKILQGLVQVDTDVLVKGWVRTRRDSKSGISFLVLYDGSCFNSIQIIVRKNLENYKSDILHLTSGCSITVKGILKLSVGKNQKYEIKAKLVQVFGWVDNPDTYPISSKKHTMEYLRKVAHLRPRTNVIGSIARIRHSTAQSIHNFMDKNGFFWVSTPLITALDTEGSSSMFNVSAPNCNDILNKCNKYNYKKHFFGKKTFLTVSGQLHGESYASALSKIYTFGPTFRAENSNTSRHLSEFWMVEPEVAFATLNDIIDLAEFMLKEICKNILEIRNLELEFLSKITKNNIVNKLNDFIKLDFIKISYTEAINILKKSKISFKNLVSWGCLLSSEHEKYLTNEYFKSPIIIKNYPKNIKAFYMRVNDDEETVAAMDILIPEIGEIIGGSQREERLYYLDLRLEEVGLNKKDYWWYRDLRRYGTIPHSGFGLGFERLISYITGFNNIRDVIPFPRYPNKINF